MVSLSRLLNITLGFVVLLSAGYISWNYWSTTPLPPVKFLSIAVLNKDVMPGDKLVIRITFDRRENCPGTSDRFLILLNYIDSEEIVYRDTVKIAPTKIGESINYIFTVPTPTDIKPGNYVFRGNNVLDCNGVKFELQLPEAGFRVE